MLRWVRTTLFSLLLGFHNALAQEDISLEELGVQVRPMHHDPLAHLLARPERCFFWNESSLLN
jgi:hypothetical protein